jgi:vitamin K-dependent gamma-carboxylase
VRRSISRLVVHLAAPVDNGPLTLFRILFGLFLILECAGAVVTGWVHEVFVEPQYHFPMIGFEWLHPLPGKGMVIYYLVMAAVGLMVMVGFYYRASMITFTMMWTITYLMQTTQYNNHYYLLILLSLMMCTVPASQYYSWDARAGRVRPSLTCPRWCVTIFIAQIAIVYTYAAVAKLDWDWLAAKPMGIWLARKADNPAYLAPLRWLYALDWLKWFMAYAGLLFDFLVVPGLLWKRTRVLAFCASLLFHLFNSVTFGIGIFPYLGISLSVFFFPATMINRFFFKTRPATEPSDDAPSAPAPPQRAVLAFYAVFFLLQILLPLRHWLYEGYVNWTEEGHRMSWHMMLRTKRGTIYYTVRSLATGEQWIVRPRDYLTKGQASRVAARPDMLWQFAQILKREYEEKGIRPVEIYAHARVSLNGRSYRPFVDSSVNLAEVKWEHFRHKKWIMPLGDK